mgnify:CR=1 FL=1
MPKIQMEKTYFWEIYGHQELKLKKLSQSMSMQKCSKKFMEESLKEMTVGIVLTFNHLRDIHGKMLQLIFTTHHFSKPPLENSQRLPKFKVPIVWLGSVIQLQLIISPLLVTLQRTHLLPDILNLRIFNQAITIPMVPEEETIKLWLEELLLIQELLTN